MLYCPPKTRDSEDIANTRPVYSGAGSRGEKLLSLLSTKNKRSEDTANTRTVYSGAGTRGEKLLSLLSTKNKRRYSEYTPRVFGCGDARREATGNFLYCPPKTREDTANTSPVYSGAGTRGEKLLSLLSTKNKRRYSEYKPRVFGCGDARREATAFFTVHQKQEKIQRIHAPCIRVRSTLDEMRDHSQSCWYSSVVAVQW